MRVTSKGLSQDIRQLQPRETALLKIEEDGGQGIGNPSIRELCEFERPQRLNQRGDKTTLKLYRF